MCGLDRSDRARAAEAEKGEEARELLLSLPSDPGVVCARLAVRYVHCSVERRETHVSVILIGDC